MQGNALVILLIEDNPDHSELIRRSFEDHRIANQMYHVSDGEMALDFLFHRHAFADPLVSPRPHLILLDLRLPRIDGMQVLREIKSTENLRHIPVVVLTTSHAEGDIANAYNNYANSYLVKPVNAEKFTKLMDDLGFYWLVWNCHPWK